jgi:hypothetical protein
VNTATGAIDHTVHFTTAQVLEHLDVRLTLSPNGSLLYALGQTPTGSGTGLLEEIRAATGRVLVTKNTAGDYDTFKATNGGVWLVRASRSITFLNASGLRPLRLPAGTLPPDGPVRAGSASTAGGSLRLYSLGRFVLIASGGGMTCVAPNTGALRAEDTWPQAEAPTWTPFAVLHGSLLATQTIHGRNQVLAVRIPAACTN